MTTNSNVKLSFTGTLSSLGALGALICTSAAANVPTTLHPATDRGHGVKALFSLRSNQQTKLMMATVLPRSKLGSRLMAIRERIVSSGTKLLSWDEVRAEVAAGRGSSDQ